MNKNKINLVPTGYVIKDYLDEYGISQADFARRTGTSEKHVSNLLNGKTGLTVDMALKIESVIKNVPASYWLNYENKYREQEARKRREEKYKDIDLESIAERFYFKEVFGKTNLSLEEQAEDMLKLLGISSFDNFDGVYTEAPILYKEDGGEKTAMYIWLKLCEEELFLQNDADIPEYDKRILEKDLDIFKYIALDPNAESIKVQARNLCNQNGIYLVIRENIVNSKIRGALTTINGSPTIYLSGRLLTHDNIWFSLMHEIGHLIYHYNDKITEISCDETDKDEKEEQADEFACNFFINKEDYIEFTNNFDQEAEDAVKKIKDFSIKEKVLPGIVVGRLEHDKFIDPGKFDKLKIRYDRGDFV